MSNDSESKYGFKDKIKAEESLKLLEKEDLNYQKLTVRGLLGRAKRVLSLTKAEDKLQNITEAMQVFENWLEEHDTNSKKNDKPSNDNKADTVPGLGFKDKEAAQKTLQILEDRDPEYQRLAVKGLIGSSKRVLGMTKNPDKVKSIKEGVEILEKFLEEFERDNRIKDNFKYLSYEIVSAFSAHQDNELLNEFLEAYGTQAKGNYKQLRTLYPSSDESTSWDIIRNRQLRKLNDKIKNEKISLFKEDGSPTHEHLEMICWSYSPQPDKLKNQANLNNKKRASSTDDEMNQPSKKKAKE